MKKPLIAVMALVDEERESLWMLPGYFDGVTEAGGIPVMLPVIDNKDDIKQIAADFDGFIFSGGPDVDPSLYNMKDEVGNLKLCKERDEIETALLREVIRLNKPVLGICRGLQLINVILGGTLYQDLPTQRQRDIKHSQERPYDVGSHKVKLEKESSLYKMITESNLVENNYYEGEGMLSVNSCHHQGIKDLAEGLSVMATATDGLIEAYEYPALDFLWAVQWHPEFMHKKDQVSRGIFDAFISKCSR